MKGYFGPDALLRLVWGGLRLDPSTYREISRTSESTRLCLAVSVLGGAVSGLSRGPALGLAPTLAALLYVIVTLAVLSLESVVVWTAARLWLRPGAKLGEVVRPIAVANAPRLADILLTAGQAAWVIAPLCGMWQLAAFVVGVQAAVSCRWPWAAAVALAVGAVRWALFALVMSV